MSQIIREKYKYKSAPNLTNMVKCNYQFLMNCADFQKQFLRTFLLQLFLLTIDFYKILQQNSLNIFHLI